MSGWLKLSQKTGLRERGRGRGSGIGSRSEGSLMTIPIRRRAGSALIPAGRVPGNRSAASPAAMLRKNTVASPRVEDITAGKRQM